MSDREDGGPAFASGIRGEQWTSHEDGEPQFSAHFVGGMSLRDYFAGQVLTTVRITEEQRGMDFTPFAECAYRIADAMLKARQA